METKYHEQFIRFGLKVQYYRKLRGMTQETFAEASHGRLSPKLKAQPDHSVYQWKRCLPLQMC